VLLGGAGAFFLAACGGDDDTAAPDGTGTTAGTGANFALVQLFDPNALLVAGSEQRAPFAIADADGVVVSGAPAALTFQLTRDGAVVGGPVEVAAHGAGLPRPYYPLVFEPDAPGNYTAVTSVEGTQIAGSFVVSEPGAVAVPQPGAALPSVETPTVADGRGVDPICTAEPACPLHEVSLSEGLTEGRPVAFLISTPKYCQVAICGPVLDVLVSRQAQFPDVRMIHAEVWTDDTTSVLAPAVQAYSLTYEPVLFLAGADGVLRQRLDNIFDEAELDAALTQLSSG
jgi:hypothetical protein